MERKASSRKGLTKAASQSKDLQKTPSGSAATAAAAPAPVLEKAASKKDLARSKSKSKEAITPPPEAPAPPMVKAPSKEKAAPARSASTDAAKRKRGAVAPLSLGLNGAYWTTGKTTTTVSRRYSQEFASSAPAPSKKHKRAAPIASGLRKNKPSYRKMITLALKHLGDAPRKGHGLAEIRKWIESRYPVPDNSTRRIRLALATAVNAKLISRIGLAKFNLSVKKAGAKKGGRRAVKKSAAAVKVKKAKTPKAPKVAKKKSSAASASPASSSSSAPALLSKKKSSKKIAAAAGRPAPVIVGAAYAAFKKNFIWQYKDNGGKWANYDPAASDIVEGCYEEYQANPHMMDVRAVHSGEWQYQVDFLQMKQTNIQHEAHRVRDIRRVENPNINKK